MQPPRFVGLRQRIAVARVDLDEAVRRFHVARLLLLKRNCSVPQRASPRARTASRVAARTARCRASSRSRSPRPGRRGSAGSARRSSRSSPSSPRSAAPSSPARCATLSDMTLDDRSIFDRVADAAYGRDELVVEAVVDLAAQVADVDVDQVGIAQKIAPPDAVEELVARVDLVAVQSRYSSSAYSLAVSAIGFPPRCTS